MILYADNHVNEFQVNAQWLILKRVEFRWFVIKTLKSPCIYYGQCTRPISFLKCLCSTYGSKFVKYRTRKIPSYTVKLLHDQVYFIYGVRVSTHAFSKKSCYAISA